MNQHRAVHQAASLLLSYPDQSWPARRDTVSASIGALPGPGIEELLRFCRRTAEIPLLDLAAQYVATFDRSGRRTLHLTHYTDGDTRRRGASLAALKARYRQYGWEPCDGELPDHLPAVLEFAARCPSAGRAVLHEHRGALTLLAAGLAAHGSPYLDVIRAVRATLDEGVRL
ncbi:nitrate reductase molybdenum cofactor assembly chaperone [Streptomyces spinosirectus]|jgi:nitrate reductase delta subunit|uniref:nitrate reductase molybdenum cofactor assembly chaperone n=1 Tax=Streptomyces TaxID=1883 RepID=UPI000FFE6D25|nr:MULTISPECIES: nitrate reductase molybdenum cofactor assembly chaperone [Streptomyces]MBY8343008.1 nitrate reductase molybdenum cofactor assembly chaperone [Streptomyces plumbidurans]UIR19196.1 nitrate reductase molybdenum cofactor assembly chaperone [Streptomyces spinosirectus]